MSDWAAQRMFRQRTTERREREREGEGRKGKRAGGGVSSVGNERL